MKILFLTRYPYEGASSRYRVHQYVPHLRALGVECHVSSFMNEAIYRATFSQGYRAEKSLGAAMAVLRRLAVLLRFKRYDLIYMQRELFPFGPPVVERLMKRLGAKLIFDYDDALFIHKPSKFLKLASRLRDAEKTYAIFEIVDCVLAGNNYLRDVASPYCRDARTFHVAEDINRIKQRPPQSNDGPFVIGWLGSRSTEKYLEIVREPLAEAMNAIPNSVLRIVGGGDFKADFPVEHWDWSLERELDALASFDLGIMPLPMEEWSLGKSGGKARTYMAAGVVPVCTAIGYNNELIEDGRTGVLVECVSDWKEALVQLAQRPDKRQAISDAARAHVERYFSVEKQAAELHQILREICRS